MLLSDPELVWLDLLPMLRSGAVLYDGRLVALPYAVEAPLLLYRRCVWWDVCALGRTGPSLTYM